MFFLLSGFFSALVWQRRGMPAFLKQQLQRVGIPLLVGCATLIPVTVWLLQLTANQRNVFTKVHDQLTPLTAPFVFIASMGHLWFLWWRNPAICTGVGFGLDIGLRRTEKSTLS